MNEQILDHILAGELVEARELIESEVKARLEAVIQEAKAAVAQSVETRA